MTAAVVVHGKISTYVHRRCRCEPCRDVEREYRQRRGPRRKQPPQGPVPHGTTNGYGNYGCRCDECRRANTLKQREYDAERRAARGGPKRRPKRERLTAVPMPPYAGNTESRGAPRPFDVSALRAACGSPPWLVFAEQVRIHPRQVHRWRQMGLTADQADVLAVRAGHHPALVWPTWLADDAELLSIA